MKRQILILGCLLAFLLTGCATSANEGQVPASIENVTLSIADVTPSGATITITDTNNPTHVYGQWYKIQQQINGKWKDMTPVIDSFGFEDIGYLTNNAGILILDIQWEWLYGTLKPGNYRLFKEVAGQYLTVDFEIP